MHYERDAGCAIPDEDKSLAAVDDAWPEAFEPSCPSCPYDELWSEDPERLAAWQRSRPRRIAVKLVGWFLVVLAGFGVLRLAKVSAARGAIASWATMGHVEIVRGGELKTCR